MLFTKFGGEWPCTITSIVSTEPVKVLIEYRPQGTKLSDEPERRIVRPGDLRATNGLIEITDVLTALVGGSK